MAILPARRTIHPARICGHFPPSTPYQPHAPGAGITARTGNYGERDSQTALECRSCATNHSGAIAPSASRRFPILPGGHNGCDRKAGAPEGANGGNGHRICGQPARESFAGKWPYPCLVMPLTVRVQSRERARVLAWLETGLERQQVLRRMQPPEDLALPLLCARCRNGPSSRRPGTGRRPAG
jgi:hypothetical protein